MKSSLFKPTFAIYKYLLPAFAILFLGYMVIDDFVLIEKYWDRGETLLLYIAGWLGFTLVYSIVFSIYYWILALIGIGAYEVLHGKMKLQVPCPFTKK